MVRRYRSAPGMLTVIRARARIWGRSESQEWARREAEGWERLATAAELNLAGAAADLASYRDYRDAVARGLLPCARHYFEDCPEGVLGCCSQAAGGAR